MKKFVLIVTVLVIFILAGTVYASFDDEIDPEDLNVVRYYPDTSEFVFRAKAPAARAGYRYKTLGFFIHNTPSNGNPLDLYRTGNAGLFTLEGNKRAKYCTDSAADSNGDILLTCRLPETGMTFDVMSLEDLIRLRLDYAPPGFDESWEMSVSGLVSSFSNHSEMTSERTLYASPIFQVSDANGVFRPGPDVNVEDLYYCYDTCVPLAGTDGITRGTKGGINRALSHLGINWTPASQMALRNYYDKTFQYSGSGLVNVMYIDETNSKVLDLIVVNPKPGQSKASLNTALWKLDQSGVVELPSTYVKDGKSYNLVSSDVDLVTYDIDFSPRTQYTTPVTSIPFQTEQGIMLITAYYEEGVELPPDRPGTTPGTGPSQPNAVCTAPSGGGGTATGPPSAGARGNLLAGSKESPIFDSTVAIPTSESLYAEVTTKEYLLDYQFSGYSGSCTYTVPVTITYNLLWEDYEATSYTPCSPTEDGGCASGTGQWEYSWVSKSDSYTRRESYDIPRSYSFYSVDWLNVYKVKNAIIDNEALPGGKVTLNPKSDLAPPVLVDDVDLSSHLTLPSVSPVTLPNQTLNGGQSGRPSIPSDSLRGYADAAVPKLQVRNDAVTFDGANHMDGGTYEESTPSPISLPPPDDSPEEWLFNPSQIIPNSVTNGIKPTTGTVEYIQHFSLTSVSPVIQSVGGLREVIVHTPVVNYSSLVDTNSLFNQSMQAPVPNTVLLGRNITFNFSSTGQHITALGYGNRDYTKYYDTKRIMFPFEIARNGIFHAPNTWIDLNPAENSFTFTIPEFVLEGQYNAVLESWAVNNPSRTSSSYCTTSNFNGNRGHYCSQQIIPLHVLGRIYDFQVYDVGDLRFENVFRTVKGSHNSTGYSYFSGLNNMNGIAQAGRTATNMLPIRPGSHPSEVATTPHNGYPFLFKFKTVGNYWNADAGIVIEPKFYFVPKNGGSAVEVDLYYNTPEYKLVKVGSTLDKQIAKFGISLNDPFRNVPSVDLDNLAMFEWTNFVSSADKATLNQAAYLRTAKTRTVDIRTGFSDIQLNTKMRTLNGPVYSTAHADDWTQLRAIQTWYGEYHLPIAPYVMRAGTNLEELTRTKYKGAIDGTESEFLKGGYIIVNLHLYAYKNGAPSTPVIAYDATSNSRANMWQIEGQVRSSTSYLGASYNYRFGDVIMFESDFSVRDDFASGR